jgi:CHAT domain-containing protein/Tfp pilus assembly protein PilF
MIVDNATKLLEVKQPEQALKAANESLLLAQKTGDPVDEATAHRCRAVVLQQLDRAEEAVAAWREAAAAWERAADGPGQVEALSAAGMLLAPGKPDEAKRLFSLALSLGKTETKRRLGAAEALHHAGDSFNLNQRKSWELLTKSAGEFLVAALTIREELTPESLPVAETLILLGHVSMELDDVVAAEKYSKRALAIAERLAPDSLIAARVLNQLGELEHDRDNLLAAREYYQRALVLLERLEPDGYDAANTLNDLGNTTRKLGDLFEARHYYDRALANREKAAPNSHAVARLLNNLGITASAWGDSASARAYLERSRALDEKLGFKVPDVLLNLGAVAADEGDFATARDLYNRALASFKGGGIPVALTCLGNLASRLGDLDAAYDYHRRALAYDEQNSPDSLNIAEDLRNLGELEQSRGKFASAKDYYERALAIREKRAPESLDVAASAHDLGDLARAQGNLSIARQYFGRALNLQDKLAPGSLAAASTLHSLGELALLEGELAAADNYHRRALAIRENLLGPNHPDVARSLASLAVVLATREERQTALSSALRAERIGSEHLRLTAQSLPERQALLYASVRPSGLDLALTLAARGSDGDTASERAVWDELIRSRALVLDEMAARHREVAAVGDSKVAQLAKELALARNRLARLMVRGPGDVPQDKFRALLDQARKEREEAERALAENSVSFRQKQEKSRAGLDELAAVLPFDSALVAFVRYHQLELGQKQKSQPREPVPSYLAFVLRSGQTGVNVVPLGTARELETEVSDWREQIAQETSAERRSSKRNETRYRITAAALRRRVWDSIAVHLNGAKRVFIVPDGVLNLVNFSALPTGRASYLIESGPLIHYLSAERDLVLTRQQAENKGLLALAAPAFDETSLFATLAPASRELETPQVAPRAAWHAYRGNRSNCTEFASVQFEPLPASAKEAESIVALWGNNQARQHAAAPRLRGAVRQDGTHAVYLSGAGATEAAFKEQAPGKRVLHLATHGFFLGGHCESALEVRSTAAGDAQRTFVTGENPLLLSGLALAGANHRRAAGPEEEDGILTAEEVAALDLHGVEWAVLSACDTGVGEVKAGEGVFGLRRALQTAGARTVIMSLWPVEDEEVRAWMKALYDRRLVKRMSTGEAMRQASVEILRSRRTQRLSTHPAHWASFVAAGDWQ